MLCSLSRTWGRDFRNSLFEHRSQPFLRFFQAHAFPLCIVFQLVLTNLAQPEIMALRMRNIPSTDRSRGIHGQALRKLYADILRGTEQGKELQLFGMVRTGRIARGRPYALILFPD